MTKGALWKPLAKPNFAGSRLLLNNYAAGDSIPRIAGRI